MKSVSQRTPGLLVLIALFFAFTAPVEAGSTKRYIKPRVVQKQPPVKMPITRKPQPRQTRYEDGSGFVNSKPVRANRKIVDSDRYITGRQRHRGTFTGGRGGSPDYAGASHRWHF